MARSIAIRSILLSRSVAFDLAINFGLDLSVSTEIIWLKRLAYAIAFSLLLFNS